MQRFTARGINFSYHPTRMVNDWRGTQWLLPAVHPQVREPSSRIVGNRRFVSSLFSSFSFFFFLFHLSVSSQIWARARAMGSFVRAVADSWLAASRAMVMTRVKAEPNRQPIRKILSFSFSFPPNLGYLFCQPATKVGRGGFSSFAGVRHAAAVPPGLSPGPNAIQCWRCTCAQAPKKPCRSEAPEKPCRSGPGPGPEPGRTSAAGGSQDLFEILGIEVIWLRSNGWGRRRPRSQPRPPVPPSPPPPFFGELSGLAQGVRGLQQQCCPASAGWGLLMYDFVLWMN